MLFVQSIRLPINPNDTTEGGLITRGPNDSIWTSNSPQIRVQPKTTSHTNFSSLHLTFVFILYQYGILWFTIFYMWYVSTLTKAKVNWVRERIRSSGKNKVHGGKRQIWLTVNTHGTAGGRRARGQNTRQQLWYNISLWKASTKYVCVSETKTTAAPVQKRQTFLSTSVTPWNWRGTSAVAHILLIVVIKRPMLCSPSQWTGIRVTLGIKQKTLVFFQNQHQRDLLCPFCSVTHGFTIHRASMLKKMTILK